MKRSTLIISIILGIIVLSVIAIVVVAILKPSDNLAYGGTILYVNLDGAIADGGSASVLSGGAGITPEFVRHRIEQAENDANIQAIVFKVNSPGGSVGASQEIAEVIKKTDIPVVIFAGDMVASGAYYISSQADKIVAKPGSLVGSIGVISQIPDLTGLYNKLGIRMQTIKTGKNKDMFERTLTSEERAKFQAMSDELYQQFVGDVAKGRKLKKDKVLKLATGELYAATTAKKLGLVDEIGGYQTAIDTAAKLANIENPHVEEYQGPNVFEELLGGSSGNAFALVRSYLVGRDITILENIRSMFGIPQYRYAGGQ
ncbi:MAG TPA: signal peptide peptidase SppA [Candidatus Aquicultor sp.]